MTIKLSTPALEFSSVPRALTTRKLHKILIKTEISPEILKEITDFSERNIIMNLNNKKKLIYDCCPRCLKAHILNKAKELKIKKKFLDAINKIIDGEPGHQGYYLDNSKIITFINGSSS